MLDHQFIVKIYQSFSLKMENLFVTEFLPGGELLSHLQREKKFSEQKTKFYAAEIILALEYLHSQNILYRDLKPENIILT